MGQLIRTLVLTITAALPGCVGPVPGSDEWVTIQQAKSAEFLRQCAEDGNTSCSYTYSYIKADNWLEFFLNALSGASLPYTPGLATHSVENEPSDNNSDLIFICGSAGLGVDFATGSCVGQQGGRTSPYNLYPAFQAPLPEPPAPDDAIIRCGGRAVDFVTGKCF